MRILIVEPYITGHHLEYLHHIYMMSFLMPESEFVFVLPSSFSEAKALFDWPTNKRIFFDLSLPVRLRNGRKASLLGSLKKSINYSKLTSSFVRKYHPDALFSIDIMTLVPLFPFYLHSKIDTIGIVYDIYLRKEDVSLREKVANYLRYKTISVSSIFKKVFILNDNNSARKLNELFHTFKFEYLPDPFVPLTDCANNYRKENSISEEKLIFSHFGSLTKRKGTLDILKAIEHLSDEECSKYVFVFAGKVNDEIKESFYSEVDRLKKDIQIIIKDDFCSYDYLGRLCKASNAILLPYHDTCKSSGLIGYASQFGVPVIAYEGGLLSELIKKYNLGILVRRGGQMNEAFLKIEAKRYPTPTRDYCKDNSIENFIKTISRAFNE